VTTRLNYGIHFVSFIQKAELGVETVVVGCDANGDVDLHGLEKSLDERTRLITMSHIPTGGGTISPAAEVGRIARDAKVPFVLDACQSSGQIPVRVREIGCTAMTATGRKYLRGPRGTGLLYVERSFLGQMEPTALDQHGVELLDANRFRLLDGARRFENYEVNHAARVGLGAAIAYANEVGMEAIGERVIALGAVCRQLLSDIPGVTVHDRGSVLGGIVTFSMSGMSPREIQQYLHTHGVNISVSGGAGGRIDFQARGIDSLARASLHYFNTREEIQKMAGLLAQAR
ncbi:MAG: aminotransferase class V-fold PLP-dependent enzyme, partial [Gammaproteobacteria bacterium]|nr:aminotransferase class V-fold PLP-dependent enzyme [Gammaproteobacteria bacterium]